MTATANVFYFGDQSVEPYDSLIDLIRQIPGSLLLDTFLCSCFDALSSAVTSLPPRYKKLFQGRNFAQLVDHVQARGVRDATITSVLSIVAQLGWLVIHRERNGDAWLQQECNVIGACTGNLAALTAVAAYSDGDILYLGPIMVQISLRLGFAVSQRSRALQLTAGSWSAGISGVSHDALENELCHFNGSRMLPDIKHIYISAKSASSVTLSGPPALLEAFLSTEPLRNSRRLLLPIYGAYHATHLPLPDLDYILGDSPFLGRRVNDNRSLLCLRTTEDRSLRESLRSVLQQILQEPLNIDDDIHELARHTANFNVHLTSIGPARMSSLERELRPVDVCRFGSRQLRSTPTNTQPLDLSESIAVVGMAGRFPGAENADELWEVFITGKDQHRLIPSDRFDVESHVDQTGKTTNTSLTPYGCFYDGVGDFDIALFKMSPREAAQTDPMQRLMLLTAYEALESAGYYDTGDSTDQPKNGTFYGVAGDDYRQANSSQDVDINYITGGTRAFGPGRVSYHFGWEGPSMSVDTACSASAVAMHQAITSLRRRECDAALSGGANLLTCSDMFAGLSRARFVNTTGPCKTFDETADGYCRADGFASVVFKRLGDAIRDKDNILGVIRSVETNHAGTAISLTHPEAETQIALFRSVLSTAGLTVDDIDHIELHGTGTQAGDLAESASVAGLLNQPRSKHRPLTISSVKPNVGHSEAASGATSLIKGLLMLQHQVIPQHIGIKTRINPKLPAFEPLGIVVPRENMHYPALAKDGKRRMLVNNFNATGGITAMLLEEYNDAHPSHSVDVRTHYPVTVSAATSPAFNNNMRRLLEYIQARPDTNLSHLSYTLTARRLHHKYRFACVVKSIEELIQKLEIELAIPGIKHVTQPFTIFVLTGQTNAIPQAKILFDTNDTFRCHICLSDQLCREMGLPSFVGIITGEYADHKATQLQLALVALEIALAELFKSWGIRPEAVIGHSLGEYAALYICNVLSLADTLWLVGKRGLLIESACKSNEYSMAALGTSSADATKLIETYPSCEVACHNSPHQTCISGKSEVIKSLLTHLEWENVKATQLHAPYGFHSAQMDPIIEDYRLVAQSVSFQKPTVKFFSTLTGEEVTDGNELCADYLCRQTREPVLFEKALHKLEILIGNEQKPFWIELGPTPACLPMVSHTLKAKPNTLVAALEQKKPNWVTISNVLSMYYTNNGSIRWDEYHKEYLDGLQLLQLPSYAFDLKRYWIQYDGDWMIRKNQAMPSDQTVSVPRVKLQSSTLQRIESDLTEKGIRKLTYSTDLYEGQMKKFIEQFEIDEHLVCPSSVFVDMAMTAAAHLYDKSGVPFKAMAVFDLELPLGYPSATKSPFRTVATQLPNNSTEVQVTITMFELGVRTELVRCRVVISDGEDWESEANSNAYLISSRQQVIRFLWANGHTTHMSGPYAARSYTTYDHALPGINEVIMYLRDLELIAELHAQPDNGDYECNPLSLETLIQFAAIPLNHAFRSDQYVCRGWSKMYHLASLVPGNTYDIHLRMTHRGISGMMIGDVYVMMYGRPMIVIKSLVFQPGPKDSRVLYKPKIDTRHVRTMRHPRGTEGKVVEKQEQPITLLDEKRGKGAEGITLVEETQATSPKRDTTGHLPSSSSRSSNDEQKISQTPASIEDSSVNFEEIVVILAEELGVEPESLTDEVSLPDLGVDSIIEISVVARLQGHTAETLPQAFLMKYNTISKLKEYFSRSAGPICN
ncbi:hypothetical protein NPX13_g1854 [Xylaria arbuscula]|uniref:Carrier domain-containing protein n=1 Tax=Xylaria arbuscula TaxID=114810 RepID=A0A9W8NKA2_9PEZI|nr:hypothetical protein NPX13_g1854 [Xylaria arbuscula]